MIIAAMMEHPIVGPRPSLTLLRAEFLNLLKHRKQAELSIF